MGNSILPLISIGDPAIASGGGSPMLLYGGIIASVAASVFMWWYFNRRVKVKTWMRRCKAWSNATQQPVNQTVLQQNPLQERLNI